MLGRDLPLEQLQIPETFSSDIRYLDLCDNEPLPDVVQRCRVRILSGVSQGGRLCQHAEHVKIWVRLDGIEDRAAEQL